MRVSVPEQHVRFTRAAAPWDVHFASGDAAASAQARPSIRLRLSLIGPYEVRELKVVAEGAPLVQVPVTHGGRGDDPSRTRFPQL